MVSKGMAVIPGSRSLLLCDGPALMSLDLTRRILEPWFRPGPGPWQEGFQEVAVAKDGTVYLTGAGQQLLSLDRSRQGGPRPVLAGLAQEPVLAEGLCLDGEQRLWFTAPGSTRLAYLDLAHPLSNGGWPVLQAPAELTLGAPVLKCLDALGRLVVWDGGQRRLLRLQLPQWRLDLRFTWPEEDDGGSFVQAIAPGFRGDLLAALNDGRVVVIPRVLKEGAAREDADPLPVRNRTWDQPGHRAREMRLPYPASMIAVPGASLICTYGPGWEVLGFTWNLKSWWSLQDADPAPGMNPGGPPAPGPSPDLVSNSIYEGQLLSGQPSGFGVAWQARGQGILQCGLWAEGRLVREGPVPSAVLPTDNRMSRLLAARVPPVLSFDLLYPDGCIYQGELDREHRPQGQGVLRAFDGTIRAAGRFQGGQPEAGLPAAPRPAPRPVKPSETRMLEAEIRGLTWLLDDLREPILLANLGGVTKADFLRQTPALREKLITELWNWNARTPRDEDGQPFSWGARMKHLLRLKSKLPEFRHPGELPEPAPVTDVKPAAPLLPAAPVLAVKPPLIPDARPFGVRILAPAALLDPAPATPVLAINPPAPLLPPVRTADPDAMALVHRITASKAKEAFGRLGPKQQLKILLELKAWLAKEPNGPKGKPLTDLNGRVLHLIKIKSAQEDFARPSVRPPPPQATGLIAPSGLQVQPPRPPVNPARDQ